MLRAPPPLAEDRPGDASKNHDQFCPKYILGDTKMPRKRIQKNGYPLPSKPDGEFTQDELDCYAELVRQIRKKGTESAASVEEVILAACLKARVDYFRKRVRNLDDIVIIGSTGSETVHPLVRELRAAECSYGTLLGKLLLTTRAALSGSSKRPSPSEPVTPGDAGETGGIIRLMKASGE